MDYEAPKVQHNVEDEPNKGTELAILATHVFEQTEAGKKLFSLLKEMFISDKFRAIVFPMHPQAAQQFGGSVEAYCGFRSGQASVVFHLEQLMEQYQQIQANEAKAKGEANE